MPELLRLTVHGAPRTKKNSGRIVQTRGRPRLLPSKAWGEWMESAEIDFEFIGMDAVRGACPIIPDHALNCRAVFYRDARRGDAVGFYQGLADLLEKRGVVRNDAQIVSWDGSRLDVDRENPRVEVLLEDVPT